MNQAKSIAYGRWGLAAAALIMGAPLATAQRSIDGSGNNPGDPTMGAANTMLVRSVASDYADGTDAPSGATRPSARAISNGVCAQSGSVLNGIGASDFIWQWGQFVDHDIDLSGGASPAEPFNIAVPAGDPFFDPLNTGTAEIGLDRTVWMHDGAGVRQQMNQISSWIDASNVYGSDQARADELRRLDGSGKLKTTPSANGDLLPFNVNGFDNAPTGMDPTLFLAGDVRANEQVGLTAMHTLFVREHNRICDFYNFFFFWLSGDQVYERARTIVGAEMQKITYEEFLPVLLGPGGLSPYSGYDPSVNGAIINHFSTASYRYGHSQLSSTLLRLDGSLNEIPQGHLPLLSGFFDPSQIINGGGIDPLLRGLSQQTAQNVDTLVVDDVRNFLFGPPGAGGFDLASLNMQRGRDHGLADYNTVRVSYGLPAVTSFGEITSDANLATALQNLYGDVNDVDLWVAGLAEDHVPGAMVGETVRAVVGGQFENLRDGDRFFYRNVNLGFIGRLWLRRMTLSRVIKRNTGIGREIQRNVFIAPGP